MPNFLTRLKRMSMLTLPKGWGVVQASGQPTGGGEIIAFAAPVEFTAAKDGEPNARPKFAIKAYTGGPMNVSAFYYPVIVDLAGLKAARADLPILLDHDLTQLVGQASKVTIDASGVDLAGMITGDEGPAKVVATHAKNGFKWQASIGASVVRREFLDAGKTAIVNGREVTGPIIIAREAVLSEVSFTAIGADGNTSASVAASQTTTEGPMNFEQWLQAKGIDHVTLSETVRNALKASFDVEIKAAATPPVVTPTTPVVTPPVVQQTGAPLQASGGAQQPQDLVAAMRAETMRCSAISRLCAAATNMKVEDRAEVEAKAINEGWSADATELHLLRANRGAQAPAAHIGQSNTITAQAMEAAICAAGKLPTEQLEAEYGDQTLQAAHTAFRGRIGLQDVLLHAAWENGYTGNSVKRDTEGVLRAAFSTLAISGILSNTANKFLLLGFQHVEGVWRVIAARRPVNDFKTITSYRLTSGGGFKKVGPGGEIKHGTLGQEKFTNKAETAGEILQITYQDIRNDDLGALTGVPRKIGRDAGLYLNEIFWTEFLDNGDFFKTDNKNYFEGAATLLQSSSLQTAEQMFMDQLDPGGKPLAVMPSILLTSTANGVTARELYQSSQVNTGGASTKDKVPNTNVWAGKYRPEVSAYLGNTSFPGNSGKAWYLLGDPNDLAVIEVVFLDGVETPTVESADADFNQLGVQMRGVFHVGVKKQDHRAAVKSKGEA